jgi:hypothetical protein
LAFHSGREADNSPPSSAEVKEWVELYFHSPNTPSWRGAQLGAAQGQRCPPLQVCSLYGYDDTVKCFIKTVQDCMPITERKCKSSIQLMQRTETAIAQETSVRSLQFLGIQVDIVF